MHKQRFRLKRHGVTRGQWENALARGLRWCSWNKHFTEAGNFASQLQSRCKECNAHAARIYYYGNHEAEKERRRGHYRENPERQREAARKHRASLSRAEIKFWNRKRKLLKYGLSLEDYDRLLAAQGGVCKLCEKPPGRRLLSVDHVHGSKVVRGILCDHCNILVGYVEKNFAMLEKVLIHIGKQ